MTAETISTPRPQSATAPAQARGLARDEVRLLVAQGNRISHARFRDIGEFLAPGDLLVVNTSATLPAAVDGSRPDGPVVVHFSSELDDGTWVVELRTAPRGADPVLGASAGERVSLPGGGRLQLLAPYQPGRAAQRRPGTRLWQARVSGVSGVRPLLEYAGRPIRYSYVEKSWPLAYYQTIFATEPGSAEAPSAALPFSTEVVTRLVAAGVLFAPIVLHTGVSSLEAHEPPLPERFRVPETTAALVNWTRERHGRVVAVGTTATRALESAVDDDGLVRPAQGWTDLVLRPEHPVRVVDGLVTGFHEPEASHLLLLEAVAGAEAVQRVYDAALTNSYLWHEFGDVCLFLPDINGSRTR